MLVCRVRALRCVTCVGGAHVWGAVCHSVAGRLREPETKPTGGVASLDTLPPCRLTCRRLPHYCCPTWHTTGAPRRAKHGPAVEPTPVLSPGGGATFRVKGAQRAHDPSDRFRVRVADWPPGVTHNCTAMHGAVEVQVVTSRQEGRPHTWRFPVHAAAGILIAAVLRTLHSHHLRAQRALTLLTPPGRGGSCGGGRGEWVHLFVV